MTLNRILGRCILFGLILAPHAARAQSTSDLAAQAGEAMQAGNYAQAEDLFTRLAKLLPDVPEVYSNLGLAQYYNKRLQAAELSFRKALSFKTDLFVPNFFLGQLYAEDGKYGEAVPLLRRAVKLQPQENSARQFLAQSLLNSGAVGEAVAEYNSLLKQNPQDGDLLYKLAVLYLHQGQQIVRTLKEADPRFALLVKAEFDATRASWEPVAEKEWRQAIAALPAVPGLRIGLADFLAKTGKWDAAGEMLEQELTADPSSYEALFRLAGLSLRGGDVDKAFRRLDQAGAIRPEFFRPLPRLDSSLLPQDVQGAYSTLANHHGPATFGVASLCTQLAESLNLTDEARRWQTTAETKRDEAARQIEAQVRGARPPATYEARRNLALKYISSKRFEEGLGLLLPVELRWKSDGKARAAVLRALLTTRRSEEAVELFPAIVAGDGESSYLVVANYRALATRTLESLVEVDPQSAELQKSMAEAFRGLKMFKEATERYQSALKLKPTDPEIYFGLGEIAFDKMHFEEAAEDYARAIELNSSDASAYVMRAYAMIELHRPDEAIPLAKRALELNPNLLEAHIGLGRALEGKGQTEAAIQELEKAASTDTDGMLHYKLFNLYRKAGHSQEAQRALAISNKLKQQKDDFSSEPAQGLLAHD
jgi:tetratricopeptide (TPR) repeat protein